MGYIVRVFLYGFIFFAGPPAVMDLFPPAGATVSPIWGLRFLALWGGLGGCLFLFSGLCWHALKKVWREFKHVEQS